ncbi:hypothetical protein DD237_001531 [Peronospora effusa]|uniref:Uncharacterized protein n=1 Tax=Peronospora effusa TaxID=542832 RepID=A0A3R7WD59_9STRA|nr:hypothetical protein DD237_001531 [Peronospora effusa]
MGPTPHGSKVLLVLPREASRKFSDNLIALITISSDIVWALICTTTLRSLSTEKKQQQRTVDHPKGCELKNILRESILEAGRNERRDDLKESSQLQKDDESGIESVVKELSTSHSCSKEKVEKREVWTEVEDVYSVSKPQEKDEDMMMISQIRSLLQQFHLVLTVQDALLLAHARYAPPGRSHGK